MTFSSKKQTDPTARAYLRVSSPDQNTEKNKNEILALANEKHLGHVEFYEEIASGKLNWRDRKIGHILEISKPNDVLIVPELSRLSRTMLGVMEILSIAMEKNIRVYSIKGSWALDNSLQSKMVAFCFSLVSEVERDLISSRTKEALQALKASGKQLGRPKGMGKSKLDAFKPEIEALLTNGSTKRFVAKRYNTSEANLYHWLIRHGIKLYQQKIYRKANKFLS